MNVKSFLEKTTSEFRSRTNSFKFYVPTVSANTQQFALEENGLYNAPQPDLLSGEIVIKEAHKVIWFLNPLDRKKGILGDLFITNFRIFLVPTGSFERKKHRQVNNFIGEFGVCLTNVESIYQISGNKSRRLFPNTNLAGRIKGLRIVCKNMRVLMLSFEQSPYDHGKHIAKTVLHHAFPGRHSLLFAYECSEPIDEEHGVPLFTSDRDWAAEMKRTCRDHEEKWRVSPVNRMFAISPHLPQWLVTPKTLVDIDLTVMARSFCASRPPTWSWSHNNGAALVRMANCLPAIDVRTQENKFMENLRAMHPSKKAPVMMELDQILPSIRDVQTSYVKLREISIPESMRQLESQDGKFHTLLENSKWLSCVSACLKVALTAAQHMVSGISVVLQEGDGRDTSAVIASLIQILLDPVSRTQIGFQSLIQKEWVAMGHPFCARLAVVPQPDQDQSSIFVLFLDCVWQLQRQFVTSFEITETYLTTVFDSCHISACDTFLFDCERQRYLALTEEKLRLRSTWNWMKQFSSSDIALFKNPLYQLEDLIHPQSPKKSHCTLEPQFEVYHLDCWAQCYWRWQPKLCITGGGEAGVHIIHTYLRSQIDDQITLLAEISKNTPVELALERRLTSQSVLAPGLDAAIIEEMSFYEVDSFFPFSNCDDELSASLAECSIYSDYDAQSVLNLTD